MSALRVIELVVAGLFFVGGIHSFWYWIRKPIDSNHPRDQIWYSIYRTGRVGLWFAVGGIFLLSGLSTKTGSAFNKDFAKHRWYLMVLLILALFQLIGGYLLGRSADRRPSTTEAQPPPQNEA
ncbi:MAG TPA: hypothetical protein VNN79_16655 [Actinomycetota bacterium]|jgi:hypothetical protein|nr:hypothetical protein [Actinomycetota bacterium]